MVWFQCEDCGENLKKPKLPGHFRICSSHKLSCIDCGEMFSQQTVQSHTQCISEAEKYGPKDQGKASHKAQPKPDKPKPNADVDVNVGLSSHAPWYCSLCNTYTTSKQTLLLHAEGKKHRAKARAFHAAQKQSQAEEPTPREKGSDVDTHKAESVQENSFQKADESKEINTPKDNTGLVTGKNESPTRRKRKVDCDMNNGEVIQAEETEELESRAKKKKHAAAPYDGKGPKETNGHHKEASKQKIKWKKLVTSTLKLNPDGVMKIKKLEKLVLKALQESGVTKEKEQLHGMLMDKITSSSRFVLDKKYIRLVTVSEGS